MNKIDPYDYYYNTGTVTLAMLIGKEVYEAKLEKIMETPHIPTLKILQEKEEKLILAGMKKGSFYLTDTEIKAEKVGEFCYTEEDFFNPINKKCKEKGLKLNTIELDTKILKLLYPDLDFDAYSFDPIGMGLNIDALSRVSGRLYKIR